jgi:hypothetical protein
MANRWCDGFGRYGGSESAMLNGSSGQAWAQVDTGNWLLSSANPRTGTWHMRSGNSVGEGPLRRVFGTALTEVFVGFACYFSEPPDEEPAGFSALGVILASFRDAANGSQLNIVLGTDGGLVIYRGGDSSGFNTAVQLHRSDPVIGAGAYQHIEIYAKAGNSTAGALEIRVDEVTKVNLTGIDTVATSNVEFSQVAFIVNGTPDVTWDLADVFANDTTADGSACDTWVGDCKSGVLMVNGDTAQADFTLSSGVSGFALLDDVPPNDSDYIDTASSTAESDFELQNGPANLSEILTVRPFVRAMKDDAGTCTIAPNVNSNGTKGTVSDQPITTAFAYYDSNVPVDPDTGVPWIPAGLNAMQHVVERTA